MADQAFSVQALPGPVPVGNKQEQARSANSIQLSCPRLLSHLDSQVLDQIIVFHEAYRNFCCLWFDIFGLPVGVLGNDPFAPGPHVTGQHTRYDAFARIGVYTCDEIYIFAYYFMLNLAAIHGIILGVGVLNTLYFCRETNFLYFF